MYAFGLFVIMVLTNLVGSYRLSITRSVRIDQK